MSTLRFWLWFTQIPGLQNQSRLALLQRFSSLEQIYYTEQRDLLLTENIAPSQVELLGRYRDLTIADRILGDCQRLNLRILTIQDAEYPDRLRNIVNPPCLLYVKGNLPALDTEATVTVVGTRDCTPYGIACGEKLGYGIAQCGGLVVSGMAKGVDAAAARGALLAGGRVVGILGNGLDIIYPYENYSLYEDVAATGVLLSEYPPGTAPSGQHFPVRNRILAGISVATLVVEAPLRSGALITAALANEQGRSVFAVPGPIDAPASRGCNALIQDGAGLASDAWDILRGYTTSFPDKLRQVSSKDRPLILNQNQNIPHRMPPATPVEPAPSESKSDSEKAQASETSQISQTSQTSRQKSKGSKRPAAALKAPELPELTEEQRLLLQLLPDSEAEPAPVDDLIEESGLSAPQVLQALTVLEMEKLAVPHSGKRYTRKLKLK